MILYLSWRSAKPVLCIHSGVVGLDDFLIHCICLLSPYTGWVNLFVVFFFFFCRNIQGRHRPLFPPLFPGRFIPSPHFLHLFTILIITIWPCNAVDGKSLESMRGEGWSLFVGEGSDTLYAQML